MPVQGSCHCGKLSFTLDEAPAEAMQCNCSICRRKGYLLTFASPDKVTLKGASEDIGDYMFHQHAIHHQFCKTCGCTPFGHGVGPDGKEMIAINLRCADGLDLEKLKINAFDGASL